MSHKSETLTVKQRAAIAALLACQTVAEAAKLGRPLSVSKASTVGLDRVPFGSISAVPATKPSPRPSGAYNRPLIAV